MQFFLCEVESVEDFLEIDPVAFGESDAGIFFFALHFGLNLQGQPQDQSLQHIHQTWKSPFIILHLNGPCLTQLSPIFSKGSSSHIFGEHGNGLVTFLGSVSMHTVVGRGPHQ